MSLAVSVSRDGYVITRDGVTLNKHKYRNNIGEPRDCIIRSLKKGLLYIKSQLNHDKLVIELDNKYLYDHLSDLQKVPNANQDDIFELEEIIEECDARIVFKKVARTRATKVLAHTSVKVDEGESIEDAFAGMEED